MRQRILGYCVFYYFLLHILKVGSSNYGDLLENLNRNDDYLHNLRLLLAELALIARIERCLVIVTDDVHYGIYEGNFFHRSFYDSPKSSFILHIDDAEDLLAPNYGTVKVLNEIRKSQCDMYLITILNGLQVKRFLRFVDRHRILNMQKRYVFLNDERLLEPDMSKIWNNMISSIFLKPKKDFKRFTISTIIYSSVLNGLFVITKKLKEWKPGKRLKEALIFPDKMSNLEGTPLPIVVYPHIPMVQHLTSQSDFTGLEIEIVRSLGVVMNFEPYFYELRDSETERWGRELSNGSYTGLLGQLVDRDARIAIGDLRMYKLYYSVIDFTRPHSFECMTFLTPESSQDDSWKTLISPFSGAMWAGVLLSLFAVGTVFYIMSFFHAILMRRTQTTISIRSFFVLFRRRVRKTQFDPRIFRTVRFRSFLYRFRAQSHNLDLFDTYENCLLYTYSMLMYVALPRMPKNWPLRVLTGWYWLYCILLTVTYRASFTAILANPAERITIDTLEQLSRSHVDTSTWGEENKELFENSFDKVLQDIGLNLEVTQETDSVTDLIAMGTHAYYDNVYFLRYLRLNRSRRDGADEVLHIMEDCVVHMPVALGLEKNSPLKPNIDKYLMRMREGGLLTKWLQDAIKQLKSDEKSPQEALMNLDKFWSSFIALIVGYLFAVCAFIIEHMHFKHIVRKHPLYDEHNPKLYYNFKRLFPNY